MKEKNTYLNKIHSLILHFSAGLIRKMVQYAQPELLSELCTSQKENLGVLLVEVVANVLDVEVLFLSIFQFKFQTRYA